MASAMHPVRFPGESGEYRAARDELLRAELGLRRQLEEVAALRRRLPLGGPLAEDYDFDEGGPDLDVERGQQVRLSQLFREGKDSLILYSFMYGPEMQRPCPSCTSILDGLNGGMPHVLQRVNVAVVAKSPLGRIREFARQRGWRNLRLLSSARNSFNTDYHGETSDGQQILALNVFVRRQGRIYHFYGTELLYAPTDARAGSPPRGPDLAAVEPAGPHARGTGDRLVSAAGLRPLIGRPARAARDG